MTTKELTTSEVVAISIALDEKITFYKNQKLSAYTEDFKEFLDIRIQELFDIQTKLGF